MTDRKVVMISSTALDLPEHRDQVRLACERAGFEPRMMESLTALDANAVQTSMRMVEEADVYLGVFAYRYGHQPKGKDLSITEMEYDRAVDKNKSQLIFFIHKSHPVTIEEIETGEGADKLTALKTRIGEERVAAFFKSPEDLRAHVIEALTTYSKQLESEKNSEVTKSSAAKFHRGTPIPAAPTPYVAHPYTLSQVRGLVGRQSELNLLTDWVTNPTSEAFQSRLFCFVAIGGMGKSALTWQWFNKIAPQEMFPLAGRLWWSFYESDASFESFLVRALCYVSGQDEKTVHALTRAECEDQLLSILSERPFLVVLDGLERIMIAYHRMDASYLADDEYDEQAANYVVGASGLPESAAQSFVGQSRMRQTSDPRAGTFLRKLAQIRESRILISSRLYPSELQIPTGEPRPGCIAHFLLGLSNDDALGLWRALGVSGSRSELVPIFRSVQGHPLLVQALASDVANYRRAPGDFAKWRADNPGFDPTFLPLKQSRTHILEHALAGLEKDVNEVLQNLVGFRMPTCYETLEALLVGTGRLYGSAHELDKALNNLEDRGLIGWDRIANRYDAHPIVRGVVWQNTSIKDKRAVYTALEAHFEPMEIPDSDYIESIEDLTPAIERYHNLVGLGRYNDAYSLFRERLDDVTYYRLAAHRERIEWLEQLIPNGVSEMPATMLEEQQARMLNALALSYKYSGRTGRSVPLFKHANHIYEQTGNKRKLQIVLSNLSATQAVSGILQKAQSGLRRTLIVNRELSDEFQEGVSLFELGRVLAATGSLKQSQVALIRSLFLFVKHNEVQAEGVVTALLAGWSLRRNDLNKAESLANKALELANHRRYELDFIHATHLQGRVAIGLEKFELAEECLHKTLSRARAVNIVEFQIQVLITIAELASQRGNLDSARDRLDEVWEATKRGPYPLIQADAFNILTDIELAEGNQDSAIAAATKAYTASWCDGPPYAYHWGLKKAKTHLTALGAPFPDLPPFDESKFEPMPEVEINPKDDNWVDPTTLD